MKVNLSLLFCMFTTYSPELESERHFRILFFGIPLATPTIQLVTNTCLCCHLHVSVVHGMTTTTSISLHTWAIIIIWTSLSSTYTQSICYCQSKISSLWRSRCCLFLLKLLLSASHFTELKALSVKYKTPHDLTAFSHSCVSRVLTSLCPT